MATELSLPLEKRSESVRNRKRGRDITGKSGLRTAFFEGNGCRIYLGSSLKMPECDDSEIVLTVTSPPYWNAIDYDVHTTQGQESWYRGRVYRGFGETFDDYLENIRTVFGEVFRATVAGGFCAIVVGTILHKKRHYPAPMLITERMLSLGWEFHQDIVWNKVTGGVKRAGSFIQRPKSGYYYPNIMTEYILVFRKLGEHRRGSSKALDIDDLFKRDIANNVWHIAPIPPNSVDHPCPFPEELVRRLILLYSEKGDSVLDPFLGSGQTALAASRLNRKCIGYDVEENYVRMSERLVLNPPKPRKFNLLARFERIAAS